MRTKAYGDVRRMPDNPEEGYGPSYSSDPKGPMFFAWVEDRFSPAVYAIRCESFEEALEHAEIALCEVDEESSTYAKEQYDAIDSQEGAIASAMFNRIDDVAHRNGSRVCANGSIRHTEALKVVEVQS